MKTWLLVFLFLFCFTASVSAACVSQTNGELTAKLTWINVDTVTTDTVNVLRSNSSGTETVLINIPYGTTYTDTVPIPSGGAVSYFYEVQAKGPGGVSVPSQEICKTFFPGPPAPTSLQVQ